MLLHFTLPLEIVHFIRVVMFSISPRRGHNNKAQGRAERRSRGAPPWGQCNPASTSPERAPQGDDCCALSGRPVLGTDLPRASLRLPWAFLLGPFGAKSSQTSDTVLHPFTSGQRGRRPVGRNVLRKLPIS